jgi:tRNA-(ms[2]io[6]A)-hydroxylase
MIAEIKQVGRAFFPGNLMKLEDLRLAPTPEGWLQEAVNQMPLLLIDHANCEKKAASTALNLMYRYVEHPSLIIALSKLAREELRHFEQVVEIMGKRSIDYRQLSSSRYAGELRAAVRTHEPARLVDLLVMSAVIEARSCERFGRLCMVLDADLAEFYRSLLKSEARHFAGYLGFAMDISGSQTEIDERLAVFLALDTKAITRPDAEFRFHSGLP